MGRDPVLCQRFVEGVLRKAGYADEDVVVERQVPKRVSGDHVAFAAYVDGVAVFSCTQERAKQEIEYVRRKLDEAGVTCLDKEEETTLEETMRVILEESTRRLTS